MKININSFLLVLFLTVLPIFLSAQKSIKIKDGFYKKEMKSLQTSIQKNFYDKASGYPIPLVANVFQPVP